ncbi:MAG TPA: Stk1 family PASTA domain-containing Ser/Thr kinase [Jiangellaceae bacterium]|nr:Stk1 family PASTA domain-containing Ser/Thr kinase [Jiangellaceae bacterium]
MNEPLLLGNRYEVGEVIGRGGMAEVRRGRDTRLGRIVALKMLRVDHSTDATFQARFRREAQSSASLNHRNVVAVYDTGEDYIDGHRIPYIVMEYVEGQTLREMLQDQARFTPERSIEVISRTLDALEYSHRAGIVHRDIKPGNIMITTAGEVKVMDFGIARSLAETGMALTQTAAVVGTAQYISPEQARGEQADARSDLYATGCVMYELLTGRPPFVGESLVSVAVSHVREIAAPPSALDPNIPRDLDAIVMKALAKDRTDRYQSAYEMRADLQRAAAGLPVAAAVDTAAATQFITPTTVAAYDATPLDDEVLPDEDLDERKGVSWWVVALGTVAVLAIAGLIAFLMFRPDPVTQAVVPNLVGQTQADATAALQAKNLEAVITTAPAADPAQVGTVMQQDPVPNTRVDEGSSVTLTIGAEPDDIAVPNVTGLPRQEAEQAIADAGLTPGTTVNEESDRPAGEVLRTEPTAGTVVPPDTTVDIYVSSGVQTVAMPNFVGMTRTEAEATAQRLGLKLQFQESETNDVPEGQVFRQSPDEGTELKENDTVVLTVAVRAEEPPEETSPPPTEPTNPATPTDNPGGGNGGGNG